MFNSKKQVDRHAQEVLRKARNENERRIRCFSLAKHYFKIREYESAKHFNSVYLTEKEDSPLAHKLQGQIWECLGDKQHALSSYKTSLEYDANQPDLVLKMCELLCESDVTMDTDRAQYWCERASDQFPYDPRVFRLKEKLHSIGGQANSSDFETLINSEIKSRPKDVLVRTRLMRLYLETGRATAAFSHATEVEAQQVFCSELPWYECFAQVCQAYSDESATNRDWLLYTTWVTVLDRAVCLSMVEHSTSKTITDCANLIFNMDQVLYKAKSVAAPRENQELYKQFQRHMSAQLCLHITTLMMKKARKEPSQWRDVVRLASPLLFFCLIPAPDSAAPWVTHLKPPLKRSYTRWVADAQYRTSQAVYTLIPLAKNSGDDFVKKMTFMNTGSWRERIYQREFTSVEQRAAAMTSHFLTSELLAKVTPMLPSPLHHDKLGSLVGVYEEVRESLHHLAWLGLQVSRLNDGKIPPQFHTKLLTGLKLTTPDLSNISPETLTILDVDSFLYATVLCASAALDVEVANGFYASDRPVTLPADIANLLCNQEQIKWWSMAHQVNSQKFGAGGDLVALRQQLQRGLEVIRVNGNHGLHVSLIVHLARTFAHRATSMKTRREEAALEARASLFWNAALPILQRVERGQSVATSTSKLFQYPSKEVSVAEAGRLLDEGRYYEACQLMKAEQHEQAIEAFKALRSPHASYNQALIYKKLANAELEQMPREEITSEMRSRHVILLTKARECLNVTWQRIRQDRRHELHSGVTEEMAEVEAALSRIEPEPSPEVGLLETTRPFDHALQFRLGLSVNSNDFGRSDEVALTSPSLSSAGSLGAGDHRSKNIHSTPQLNGHGSTPRRNHYSDSKARNNSEIKDMFGQLIQMQTMQKDMTAMQKDITDIKEKMDMLMDIVNDVKRTLILKPAGVTDDLYMFGDEEEYHEDVLNTPQYQPPFVPTYPTPQPAVPAYFPPAARGVQGTSTVTYGAPPAAPVLPLLPCYQPPQNLFYNTPGLPFTDPHQLPDFLRQNIPKPVVPQQPPPPPVNVVITTSDTLPTGPPPLLPTLSVTIPPQHRLGTISTPPNPSVAVTTPPPHQFQIAMPATATTPTFEKSPICVPEDLDSEEDNDATYDPCPNFRPIVPLPNEVSVKTGEEDDDILFENRAKLFRFVDKEWKERGLGIVKILKSRVNDKVRLVMRRDQVHKICANHLLQSSMELTYMKNSDRALIWVAQDFAEEVVQVEKFCIKFKLPEEAEKFKEVFNDSKEKYGQSPQKPKVGGEQKVSVKSPVAVEEPSQSDKERNNTEKVSVGGFTFTSPPKVMQQEKAKPNVEAKKESQPPAASPFAAFSFSSQNTSSTSKSLFANLSNAQSSAQIDSKTPDATNKTLFSGPLFGNVSQIDSKTPDGTNKSLFSGPLFGNASQNDSKTPDATNKSIFSGPLFGNVSQNDSKTPDATNKSLFSGPLFGNVSQNDSKAPDATNKTLFSGPLFGNVSQNDSKAPDATNKTIFSGPLFGNVSSEFDSSSSAQQPTTKTSSPFTFSQSANSMKETPKSILKETVVNSPTGTKSSPGTKHVIFKETPTLTSLLTNPDTEVKNFKYLSTQAEDPELAFSENSTNNSFAGAGTPLFGNVRTSNDSEADNVEEFVPTAEFKPVISLPDLVDVKTGEEGEEVLFDERAKLMRFDSGNKEWKERGLGQMKILKDSATGVTRFLMRREQVFKVCCNHRIIPSLELRPSPSSEKAWTWYAVDHSEGEPKNELFAVRFKTVDVAKLFKESVDQVQKQVREEGTSKRSCPDSSGQDDVTSKDEVSSKADSGADSLPKLVDMFRPKAGSWECKACYTVNGAKDSSCVSCDSPKEKPKSPGPSTPTPSPAPAPAPVLAPTQAPSLVEMFKPKAGSWECSFCFCRNDGEKTSCPACNGPKPGHEADVKETPKSNLFGSSTFSFGVNQNENKGTGFNFGTKPAENAPSAFTFGISPIQIPIKTPQPETSSESLSSTVAKEPSKTTAPPLSFSFGQSSLEKKESPFTFTPKKETADSSTQETKPAVAPFKFGDTSNVAEPSFVFGTPASKSDGFAFGSTGKFEFSFSGVRSARSPTKSPRSPGTTQESESEQDEPDEDEGDHIVFQPVVPLPDKVPLTTGEENEAVLYSHRAKLFRFTQGEWKERGIGDVKILRHDDTHKIRLLMRREPILKLCLNHYLSTHMSFTPKDDRSWLWCAQDFAEGTLTDEQFCIRFKSPEIAAEFKAAIESAQGELESGVIQLAINTSRSVEESQTHELDPDELEILYEADVPEELREAALKLQLPPNFYRYLDAPPCPGCPGCETDSDDIDSSQTTSAETDESKYADTFGVRPPKAFSIPKTSQPFTFTVPQTSSSTVTSIFGGSSTPSPVQSSFSFNFSAPTNTPTTTTAQTLSGFNATQSMFGGSPSFQSQTGAKSVFGGTSTSTSSTPSLFFGSATSQSPGSFSFGSPQNKNFSIFSGSSTQNTVGTPENSSPSSVFSQTPASVFGTPAISASNNSPFFSNIKSFDKSPQESLFGGAASVGAQGPKPLSLFGNLVQPPVETNSGSQTDSSADAGPTFLFKPTTSFSDIVTTSKEPAFGTGTTNANFSWNGAGTPLFGMKKPAAAKKDEGSDGEEEEAEGEEDNDQHDPQFAPIVPLPDAIEVRTGEEDEEKEFSYRAKFYRYDSNNKEWKERGVGEMKILRHHKTNSYRLLLRREQVHKVVCNQLITADLGMSPLSTSGNSYCWAGMNMAEEYPEPRLEKVAVRFKNADIANEFKAKVDECVAIVAARK